MAGQDVGILPLQQASCHDSLDVRLQDENILVTLGKDEGGPKIKVWSCQDPQPNDRPPALLRTLDCFVTKQGNPDVSQLAVHNSWPQLVYALGLSDGSVTLIRADTGD